jgi:DNA-directed RNA polymerase subunit alpha
MTYLPEMDLVKITQTDINESEANFSIEPLLPGYGPTLGNTLRRVLLSSLKGAAITAVKINDATHEFTSTDGVTEDIVAITLNLKGVHVKYDGDEPATITLNVKGPKTVVAGDFKTPAGVEVINSDHVIANVEKGKTLTIEARVESGKGYLPTEQRREETLPVGMIAIDAIFTPIKKIHHNVINTRVGQKTDFDKLDINIATNGSITPVDALKTSVGIVMEYMSLIDTQISTDTKKPKATKTKKSVKEDKEEVGE